MAPPAIIAKLNRLLDNPIDSECKVVYLLCEVRKLLEQNVLAPERPFALKMYCHWALHVALDHPKTTSPFLKQVDDYVHGKLVGPEDFRAEHRMVQDFLTLNTLRGQLSAFCQLNGICPDLTESDDRWAEFVTHYAGVIEDGSLEIRGQNHGMEHVKRVIFRKGRDAKGEFNQIPFNMVWRVDLLDDQSVDIEVSARPVQDDLGPMSFVGFHLNN